MDFLLQHAAEPEKIQFALTSFYHQEGLVRELWIEEEHYHLVAYAGDVSWLLSVYEDAADELALARFLAHTLQTKVIISDRSINPYTWVLLDEAGREQPIWQDSLAEQERSFLVDHRHKYLLTQ
ncbi:hypothetical protein [Hymenobacter norwichensis]|uniref:hypothetical protein n=1 Tax=Hymenobacter norwichensis TaxID=223903 RepID=UPI0003B43D70|nr:hypothetical protein [Hymenobacter norwichensis]